MSEMLGAGMTGGQRNAVRTASSYLETAAFSRQGLIEQIQFDDYTIEDATFAVDYLAPDWNTMAAMAAKEYLDVSGFSQKGLIDQLVFSGFTGEQARRGVDEAYH